MKIHVHVIIAVFSMFFQWDVLKNTDSFVVKDPTDHLATQPPGAGRGCRQR
jgi:hypothetical protein